MNISKINNTYSYQIFNAKKTAQPLKEKNNIISPKASETKNNNSNYDSFVPSFSAFRRKSNDKNVKKVFVHTKELKIEKPAIIRSKNEDNKCEYTLFVDDEEAGSLHLNCDTLFPEDNFLILEADNEIPQIDHFISKESEEYSGIDRELLLCAMEESRKRGQNGALWVTAKKENQTQLAIFKVKDDKKYIPFYYKMGFISPNEQINNQIRDCAEKNNYRNLPEQTILLLPSKTARQYLNENQKSS